MRTACSGGASSTTRPASAAMLPEEKRKTNIGVVIGILLQMVGGSLEGPLAALVVLIGLAVFIWGCSS